MVISSRSNNVTQRAGIIAIDLVIRTLCHIGKVKFKKPSITNWPAYVPVMVELWPAASRPTAQIYLALFPKVSASTLAPVLKSSSTSSSDYFVWMYEANVEITAVLIINDTNNEHPDSKRLYILASWIAFLFLISIYLVNTKDECRYRLWGIITAPIKPNAANTDPSGTEGTIIPTNISSMWGFDVKKFMQNVIAITDIKKAKNPSSFLTPK